MRDCKQTEEAEVRNEDEVGAAPLDSRSIIIACREFETAKTHASVRCIGLRLEPHKDRSNRGKKRKG